MHHTDPISNFISNFSMFFAHIGLWLQTNVGDWAVWAFVGLMLLTIISFALIIRITMAVGYAVIVGLWLSIVARAFGWAMRDKV